MSEPLAPSLAPLRALHRAPRVAFHRAAQRLARTAPALAAAVIAMTVTRVGLAEVVVMRTGSRIACSRAVPENDRLRLELPGGSVLHVARADVKRVESGADARSADRGIDPMSGGRNRESIASGKRLENPVEPEVTYHRAAAAAAQTGGPTIVGSLAGVAPVPTNPQLRNPSASPVLDARRQAFAQRARITPGAAGALLGRAAPGTMSTGGSGQLDSWNGRDAPRVPR